MRRSPLTIGVLAAELAVGALVLAPPAAADDTSDSTATDPPAPAPSPPAPDPVEIPLPRTGRAGDAGQRLPTADAPAHAGPITPRSGRTGDEPAPHLGADTPAPEQSVPAAPSPTPATTPKGDDSPAPSRSGNQIPASPEPAAAPSAPAPVDPPASAPPPVHTVVEGDTLWHIAASHLATRTGRDVAMLPVADIAAYWVRVCEANRGRLRSGDLDLIFPGEVVELPAL